ncbi:MAG: hypothetical protein AB7D37_03805 [Desulfovibrio sp.]
MAKTGRPSTFTEEMGEEICRRVSQGESLRQVLLDPDMPTRGTVYGWREQFPAFAECLARAHEDAADWHADAGLSVLREARGEPKEVVAACREIARYHLSLAKVHDPKRYGEQSKFQVEHSGSVGQPLQVNVIVSEYRQTPTALDASTEEIGVNAVAAVLAQPIKSISQ